MDLQRFIEKFEPDFQEFLNKKQLDYRGYTTNRTILQYVEYLLECARGGKRLRPYVAYLAYKNCEKPMDENITNYLISIEAIHLFLLIHDDVMDKGLTRRGVDTSQVYIKKIMEKSGRQGDLTHISNMQAILIGDLLMWSAFEPLHQSGTDKNIKMSVLKKFHQLVDEVGLGQMLDVDMTTRLDVTDKEITEKIKKKSALYTFAHPMQIGAILGGEKEGTIKKIGEIGEAIGIAFQIQDDLLDAVGDPEKTKKSALNDIKEGQHTHLSQYILKNGSPADKALLKKYWRKDINKNKTPEIQKMLRSSGAVDHSQKLARRYFNKSIRLINESDLQTETKANLVGLVKFLEKRNT